MPEFFAQQLPPYEFHARSSPRLWNRAMRDMLTPLTEEERGRLDDFLSSFESGTAMDFEEFDGFLCALVVGPDLVNPSEYWPHILNREQPGPFSFKTQQQAEEIMTLAARHWNTIVETLGDGKPYVPMVFVDDEWTVGGNAWAIGFFRGVNLRVDSWEEFLEDKEYADALLAMHAFARENHPDPELRIESPTPGLRKELLVAMAAGLMEIYEYFQEKRDALADAEYSREPIVRSTPKIGRNEPCPCGSGKKYKQCCGREMH